MRIGQILVESGLITAEQLSEALDYAAAKGIFIGKALKLLQYLNEKDLVKALQTQKLIRMDLSPVLAIDALKRSSRMGISLGQALQEEHEQAGAAVGDIEIEPQAAEVRAEDSPEGLIKNGDELLIKDHCNEAEKQYQRALDMLQNSLGTDHIELTPVLERLGNTYLAQQLFDKAETSYQSVVTIKRNALSEEHPQVAAALEGLADLYKVKGEDDRAIETHLQALDVLEKNLPSQLRAYAAILKKITAPSQNHVKPNDRPLPVGEILRLSGLLSERELEMALKMSKSSKQPLGVVLRENCMIGDRDLQSALKAQFCVRHGVLSEHLAIELLTRAARRDISLERLLHEAGVMVSDEENFAIYRQIAADLDSLVAAESSSVGTQTELAPIAYRLGSLYEQVGDQSQAEVYYARALKIWGATVRGDLVAAKACVSLAKIYQAQNRHSEAVPLLQKALEHRQHALGATHEETIEIAEDIAEMELELHNAANALNHAQEALTAREQQGQTGGNLLRAVLVMGDAYRIQRNYEAAQESYKRAMALTQSDKPTAALAAVMEKLGDLYLHQKLAKAAIPMYKSALMILEAAGKKESKGFENLQAKIAREEQLQV